MQKTILWLVLVELFGQYCSRQIPLPCDQDLRSAPKIPVGASPSKYQTRLIFTIQDWEGPDSVRSNNLISTTRLSIIGQIIVYSQAKDEATPPRTESGFISSSVALIMCLSVKSHACGIVKGKVNNVVKFSY